MKRKHYFFILTMLILGAVLWRVYAEVKTQFAEVYNNRFHPKKSTPPIPNKRSARGEITIIHIGNGYPRMQQGLHSKQLMFFVTIKKPLHTETISKEYLFDATSLAQLKKGQVYAARINPDDFHDVAIVWTGAVKGKDVPK